MGSIHIRMGGAMGGGAPVYATIPNATEEITSTASNTVSTISAESGDFIRVKNFGDVGVYIAVGKAPLATIAGKRDRLMPGEFMDLAPASRGDRVAVIDAE